MIRLDKYLADMGMGTRKEMKQKIRKGFVTIGGVTETSPERKVDAGNEEIYFEGQKVSYAAYEYFMLNKPAGVISATEDRHTQTVVDLIDSKRRKDLFPVGRLDKDTEGLLLITNDGGLAHALLSPKKHIDKVYFAKVRGIVTESTVEQFARGINIGRPKEEEWTRPSRLEIINVSAIENRSLIRLVIQEGKFHQVKRMFRAVDMEVEYLKRESMGSLKLDETLSPGRYRKLTESELKQLKMTDKIGDTKEPGGILDGIEAVIFDLDGTLLDSMWIWPSVDDDFLEKYNLEKPDNFHEAMEGKSYTEVARLFLEFFPRLPLTVEDIKQEWLDMTYEKYTTQVRMKEGAYEFINALCKRGIKAGIATSNARELVDASLKALGIEHLFDSVHTACEAAAGKPAPDVYLMVAEELHVCPERCLVFEDVPMGILAGKNAGMRVCGVDDDFSRPQEARKKEMADYYIYDYHDIRNHTYEVLAEGI